MIVRGAVWAGRWGGSGRAGAPALFLGSENVVRWISWKISLNVRKGVRFSRKVTGGRWELGVALGSLCAHLVHHQRNTTVSAEVAPTGPGAL